MKENPLILDVYPTKAQYTPNDPLTIVIETSGTKAPSACQIEIFQLHRKVHEEKKTITLGETTVVELAMKLNDLSGYGIDVHLLNGEGQIISSRSSAFDVAAHWSQAPRYGFLSDFHPREKGQLEDVETLCKYHINVVQFYDWMYRHDQLLPPQPVFRDPLGRELSLEVVKEKIDHCHDRGMAALAYGAVYASLKDFFEEHTDWGLFQNDGIPYTLADLFYLMDISPESPWTEHIIRQFESVIAFGFDGIHLDQYGYPKRAHNAKQEVVDLAKCFPSFINRTKQALRLVHEDVGLIFNNVSNFPTYATATADQEAVYIEVWSPVNTYRELRQLIDQTRRLADGKQVILAAYLAPFHPNYRDFDQIRAENGALTAMATIFANGAYHLLIGEKHKVLTEGYYPNYGEMSPGFREKVRKYYDFIVRYRDLLFSRDLIDLSFTHTGGYNSEIGRDNEVEVGREGVICEPNGNPGTVWTIVKEKEDVLVVHLINLTGYSDERWNAPKENAPTEQRDIPVRVLMVEDLECVFVASPDVDEGRPQLLPFRRTKGTNGIMVEVVISRLQVWSTICFVKRNSM